MPALRIRKRSPRAPEAPQIRRQLPRGARYIIPGHEDRPYVVHRVSATEVVVRNGNGFIVIPRSRMKPGEYGFDWWHYG